MADDPFAAVRAMFQDLATDARAQAERKALRAVGKLFEEAIEERTPVHTGPGQGDLAPGELKADIKARVHVATDEELVQGKHSRVRIGPSEKTAYVANMVENGHANKRGRKGSAEQTTHGHTPAHPFVRPAFDVTESKAIDVYIATMTAEIQKRVQDAAS